MLNHLSMKKSSIGGNKYLDYLWERKSSWTTFRWCWHCMKARSGDGLSIPGNLAVYIPLHFFNVLTMARYAVAQWPSGACAPLAEYNTAASQLRQH
jgi:hypothetical protein